MFAQQQTQQLVGSARTARVVSSRYVFHIDERKDEEREISFVLWILSFSNFKRAAGGRRRRLWISFLARFWVNEMIPKRSIHSKKENENGERERVTSLVSFERERERENETFIPRSTRSNSCWRRLIFFLFFSPTASLGWTKFSFLSHKILTKYHSLSNATM